MRKVRVQMTQKAQFAWRKINSYFEEKGFIFYKDMWLRTYLHLFETTEAEIQNALREGTGFKIAFMRPDKPGHIWINECCFFDADGKYDPSLIKYAATLAEHEMLHEYLEHAKRYFHIRGDKDPFTDKNGNRSDNVAGDLELSQYYDDDNIEVQSNMEVPFERFFTEEQKKVGIKLKGLILEDNEDPNLRRMWVEGATFEEILDYLEDLWDKESKGEINPNQEEKFMPPISNDPKPKGVQGNGTANNKDNARYKDRNYVYGKLENNKKFIANDGTVYQI